MAVEDRRSLDAVSGRLEVRPGEHAALVDGKPLALTVRELQLLTTLAANPQRILTRAELYGAVWGREPRHDDRSVDVYVSRLRSKLSEELPGQRLIHEVDVMPMSAWWRCSAARGGPARG